MPSPFPGMDPYLEGARWMRFHAELSVEIARQLSARLPPRYVAHTNERFVTAAFDADEGVAISTSTLYPDADITTAGPADAGGEAPPGDAVALASAPLRMATVI